MNRNYADITSRILEEPSWWQEGGIPRYGQFEPGQSTGVYTHQVALMEIACQACDRRFTVALEQSAHIPRVDEQIREGTIEYGDPPNVRCCPGGPSMTSVPIRIQEYWHRGHHEFVQGGKVTNLRGYSEWRRDPSLEVEFPVD